MYKIGTIMLIVKNIKLINKNFTFSEHVLFNIY